MREISGVGKNIKIKAPFNIDEKTRARKHAGG